MFIRADGLKVQVGVDSLSEIRGAEGQRGFDLLVLPSGHKEGLLSQVEEHIRKKSSDPLRRGPHLDVVTGKGQGLVILLHGMLLRPLRAGD